MKNTTGAPDPTVDLPGRSDLEKTVIVNNLTPEEVPPPEKRKKNDVTRRVGLLLGSSPVMSEESHDRLRTRLRLSALLLGSGLGVYLILKLLNLFQTAVDPNPMVFWVHVAITAATLGVAWRLCANCKYTSRHLRVVEFIVFCGPALLFALVSHAVLADVVKGGFVTDITSPWLLLIFTYTVLIPNTWQRAAMVIIPVSLIPIALALSARLTTEDITAAMQADPSHPSTVIRVCLGMTLGSATAI